MKKEIDEIKRLIRGNDDKEKDSNDDKEKESNDERETTMTRRKTTNDDGNDKPDNKLRLKVNRKLNVGRQS
jgi:hypothetical protein